MRKLVCSFIALFLFIITNAQLNIWGSAVYITVNGNAQFYNTKEVNPPYAIGNSNFSGNLGVFGKNSGNLKINGAEVNINSDQAICYARIFYCIYKNGERPVNPIFNAIELSPYCNCSGSSFTGCGGKACYSSSDKKFQYVTQSIDLTQMENGDYTIEVFYTAEGGENCTDQHTDNNNGSNYKASFTLTTALALNITFLNALVREEDILIKWVVQNDADISNYEVEKSTTGLNFSAIQNVASVQNSISSSYIISDPHPVIGTNYYRIKSYNINGTVNLSRVFRVYYGKVGNTVLIYPNPVAGQQLTIRFAGVKKGSYKMTVLGTNGQTITTQNLQHDGIDKTIKVELPPKMAKGIYRLFLIDKYQFYKQSFIVK